MGNSPNENKLIARGIYFSYIQYFITAVLTLVMTPIMLSYLGQSAYGLWVTLGSIAGYLTWLNFGMHIAAITYTAGHRARGEHEALNKALSTTLVFFLAAGILAILISLVLVPFIPRLFHLHEDLTFVGQVGILIMGSTVAVSFLGGLFGYVIYGHQRVDIFMIFSIIQAIANALFTVLFLRMGFGLIGVFVAALLGTLIMMALSMIYLRRCFNDVIMRAGLADWATLKRIGPFSFRVFVMGLTTQATFQTSSIIISIFLAVSLAAPYTITYNICFLAPSLAWKIPTSVFPTFSKSYAVDDMSGLRFMFLRALKSCVAIYMALAICTVILGPHFINLWVGNENFAGMGVFAVFIGVSFFHSFLGPIGNLLQAIGKNKEVFYSNIVMALLNLGISVVLVQRIGLLGVALGMLIAQVCAGAWFGPLIMRRYTGLTLRTFFLSGVLPPVLVAIPVGAISFLLIQHLLPDTSYFYLALKGTIIVAIYLALYLAMGATREERHTYLSYFLRIGRD